MFYLKLEAEALSIVIGFGNVELQVGDTNRR